METKKNENTNGAVSTKIGSFRSADNLKAVLPQDIYEIIFESEKLDNSINFSNYKANRAYLNNAAFGKSYNECFNLSKKLHDFSENDPDVYYDQALLPLVQHTYRVANEFFQTKNMVLTPNCTISLKAIRDTLVENNHFKFAYLSPLYGAT